MDRDKIALLIQSVTSKTHGITEQISLPWAFEIADYLIENGIGDITAEKHRADVAEEALRERVEWVLTLVTPLAFTDGNLDKEIQDSLLRAAERLEEKKRMSKEQESLNDIINNCKGFVVKNDSFWNMQNAIDELEAYHKLGTPEEINDLMELAAKLNLVDLVRENLRVHNSLRHTEANNIALKAENERLTKQLENSVVLPKPFIKEACYDGLHKRYEVYHSTVETVCSVCDDTFDTLEAAESRLKELEEK